MSIIALATIGAVMLPVGDLRATTDTQTGAAGATGTAGVYPLPGGPGGTGGAANATANAADSSNTATATGGAGGTGGVGGFQAPTNASAGGPGGAGGLATASAAQTSQSSAQGVSSTATAVGGNGGNGGNSALIISYRGPGGAGANGGNATASANSFSNSFVNPSSSTATARATGGNGGNGGNLNGAGGAGGFAGVGTVMANSSGAAVPAAIGVLIGGNGGAGVGTGSGGAGAAESLNNSVVITFPGHLTGSQAALIEEAIGGSGGASVLGTPGMAGTAGTTLNYTLVNAPYIITQCASEGGAGGDTSGALGGAGATAFATTTIHSDYPVRTTAYSNTIAFDIPTPRSHGGNILSGSGTGGSGGSGSSTAQSFSSGPIGESWVEAWATAYGGDGGSVLNSATGSGGTGGSAQVTAIAVNSSSDYANTLATATGGAGGQGQGVGFFGGIGGTVNISSPSSVTSSSGTATGSLSGQGGAGGQGLNGASGGSGGAAILTNALSGSTTGALTLTQSALGGNGGSGDSGSSGAGAAGGAGGAGTSTLNYTLPVASSTASVSVSAGGGFGGSSQLTSAAAGGNAYSSLVFTSPGPINARVTANTDPTFSNLYGDGGGVVTGTGNGGAGSNGTAAVAATSTGGGTVSAQALVYGGNGGQGMGAGFAGGAGGGATINASTGTSNSGTVSVEVDAYAGHGGPGSGGAIGGNGANVTLNNAATGSTTGTLYLTQLATGGAGGGADGAKPGIPGTATSNASQSFTLPSYVDFIVGATGGDGGSMTNFTPHAGAAGSTSITLSGTHRIRGTDEGEGGEGGWIAGGASGLTAGSGGQGTGTATVTGTGTAAGDSSVVAWGLGRGGHGGNVSSVTSGSGGNGGPAVAFSTAIGVGLDPTEADASAFGGVGGTGSGAAFHSGNNGDATATATSTNSGGEARAGAGASSDTTPFELNGASPGLLGVTNATATATGLNIANASAGTAFGRSGVSSATARANSGLPFAFVQANATSAVDFSAHSVAGAYVSQPAPTLGAGSANQSTGYVVGLPLSGDVTTLWASATNVKNAFINNPAAVQGLGLTDLQYPSSGSGAPHTYSAALEFNESNVSLSTNALVLGLLGTQLDGTGLAAGDSLRFRIMRQGIAIVDQTFTTNVSFQGYFTNTVLLLGAENAGVGTANLDLQFLFDLNGKQPLEGLGLQFVLGSSFVAQSGTWANAAGGPWGTPGNWTANTMPDGPGMGATFGSAISSPQTVNVDGGFTVGAITFDNANSYTLSGGSITIAAASPPGFGAIIVNNGTHTIASALNLTSDTHITTAAGTGVAVTGDMMATGRTITKLGLGTAQSNNVRAQSLNVSAGSVKISPKGTPNSPAGTSIVQQLLISAGANLDLANNSMIVDYTGSVGTQVSDIRNHLKNGRLSSSSASSTTRLGYGDNALLHKSTFAGQSVDSSSILIKYTYAGDSDLDGDADGVDIGTWATNFTGELGGTGSMVWTQGDWDYDGDVDGVDAGLWAQAFTGELGGAGLGSLVVDDPNIAAAAASILRGMGMTVVPEPAMLGIFGVFASCLPFRCRRRR